MGSASPSIISSRERILEAAKALFAKHGYESTATAAICRRAGTSESQLLKHFESKQGVLEAIFETAWRQINPAIRLATESLATPRERIKMLIEMVLNFLDKDQELLLLVLLEGRRIRNDGEFVVLVPGFLEFVKIADNILAHLARDGELVPDIQTEAIRSGLMGAVEGLLRDQLLAKFIKFSAAYSEAEVRAVCFRFLNSCLRPPRAKPQTKVKDHLAETRS